MLLDLAPEKWSTFVTLAREVYTRLKARHPDLPCFVMWFVSRDYDDMWESYLQFQPNAALLRLWRDNGLYTGDGKRRSGLDTWRAWLARRRIG